MAGDKPGDDQREMAAGRGEVPMVGSDNVSRDRDRILRDRDKALRDGLAKALQAETVPPPKTVPPSKAKPRLRTLRLKIMGVLGGWISAIARAARQTAVAPFGAAAALLRSLKRWESVTAVAAVIAAVAAVLAWSESIDTATRQISTELLGRFNSDEMWKARLTLERYFYLMSGDRISPAELVRQTEDYFRSFVYQKVAPPAGRLADRVKFGADREKQEEFLRQVDQSRRRIKNFYEDIMVFTEGRLITSAFREKVLKGRFYRNTGDFLECFWLPVELGQNAALYQGRKADNDKRACQVVDWYREKFPVAGRSFTPCAPYAARQPDFCVDPKAEPAE